MSSKMKQETGSYVTDRDGFAEIIASNTSKVAMVFRRYDKLALRNILSLSDELDRMDRFNDELDKIDRGVPDRYLENGPDRHLEDVIKRYHEALLLYSEILKLKAPAPRTIDNLQRKIDTLAAGVSAQDPGSMAMGSLGPPPWGHYRLERRDIKSEYYPDLISLYTPAEDDKLSRLVYTLLWPFFIDRKASIRKDRNREGKILVDEGKVRRFVTFVGMIFAVGFLVTAMWVLWKEGDNMAVKLGTVTAFVFAFAFWVGMFTSAGRKEVISATSAYAAVLVVYVGSTSYTKTP